MNVTRTKKAAACLFACLLAVSATTAMPAQGALTPPPKPVSEVMSPTKPERTKITNNPVVARNTTTRTAPEKPVVVVKEPKKHDKHTISRCWKRLMEMAREANMAHRKKKD